MDKMTKAILLGSVSFGVVLLVVGFVLMGGISGNIAGDDAPSQDDNTTESPAQGVAWEGRSVNHLVTVENNNGNTVQGVQVYEFAEEPDNWKDQEAISNDLSEAQANRTTDADGQVTVTGEADTTDYLVVKDSGTYYEFATVTYASGNSIDESLSDYNNAPREKTVSGLTDYYSMSTGTIDLGVNSNTTSAELQGEYDIDPSTDTEVRLQKAVVYEGNNPPQDNSDNTGDLDEGTEEITVSIITSNEKVEKTVLTDSGIDELSKGDNPADGEFEIALGDRVFNDDQGGTIRVDYVGDTTTLSATADDEELSDGEDILGVQLIDDLGQTPGQNAVTG